jgi:two-component system, response regulator
MYSSKKILLVEDNPDDIELTLRAFRKSKIMNEIVVKRDGEEAVEYLFGTEGVANNKTLDLPILILLDLKIPKIDGLDVLKRIKNHERTKSIPTVILTSSNEQTDITSGYLQGCNSYIRKPVDFNQFAETVKQLGLYWLVLNELPFNKNEF